MRSPGQITATSLLLSATPVGVHGARTDCQPNAARAAPAPSAIPATSAKTARIRRFIFAAFAGDGSLPLVCLDQRVSIGFLGARLVPRSREDTKFDGTSRDEEGPVS